MNIEEEGFKVETLLPWMDPEKADHQSRYPPLSGADKTLLNASEAKTPDTVGGSPKAQPEKAN